MVAVGITERSGRVLARKAKYEGDAHWLPYRRSGARLGLNSSFRRPPTQMQYVLYFVFIRVVYLLTTPSMS